MELSLSERRIANAVFLGPDASAVYHTDTSTKAFSTRRETKVYRGNQQVRTVQLHRGADVVDVQGHSVNPHRAHSGTA